MSLYPFYVNKAEQCDRLAAQATDSRTRAEYLEEARLWREIAEDIARQDRSEGLPP